MTIQLLWKMHRENFPDFLFSSNHMVNLQQLLGYDYAHIIDPEGLSGGLTLFWKVSYNVEMFRSDKS